MSPPTVTPTVTPPTEDNLLLYTFIIVLIVSTMMFFVSSFIKKNIRFGNKKTKSGFVKMILFVLFPLITVLVHYGLFFGKNLSPGNKNPNIPIDWHNGVMYFMFGFNLLYSRSFSILKDMVPERMEKYECFGVGVADWFSAAIKAALSITLGYMAFGSNMAPDEEESKIISAFLFATGIINGVVSMIIPYVKERGLMHIYIPDTGVYLMNWSCNKGVMSFTRRLYQIDMVSTIVFQLAFFSLFYMRSDYAVVLIGILYILPIMYGGYASKKYLEDKKIALEIIESAKETDGGRERKIIEKFVKGKVFADFWHTVGIYAPMGLTIMFWISIILEFQKDTAIVNYLLPRGLTDTRNVLDLEYTFSLRVLSGISLSISIISILSSIIPAYYKYSNTGYMLVTKQNQNQNN